MKSVLVLAENSLRESFREKIFIVFVSLALILLGLSVLLGSLSFTEQKRILFNVGLMGIHISSLSIAIFMGAFSIPKEIEKQTCLLVLSRPISRNEFILGKFLGIASLIFLLELLLFLFLAVLLQFDFLIFSFIWIFLGSFLESLILLAMCLFVGITVRPAVAVLLGYGTFLVGHWLVDLQFFAQKSASVSIKWMFEILRWICPNLYLLNWRNDYWLVQKMDFKMTLNPIVHGLAWIFLLVLLANFNFRRKDIV
jgi:ABC-type transport system involved in multi-copper enzyme maturation permease subunit